MRDDDSVFQSDADFSWYVLHVQIPLRNTLNMMTREIITCSVFDYGLRLNKMGKDQFIPAGRMCPDHGQMQKN